MHKTILQHRKEDIRLRFCLFVLGGERRLDGFLHKDKSIVHSPWTMVYRLWTINYFLQVFTPTNVYNGQKLITDVAKKIPPSTTNTVPQVPATVPVKYNPAKTIARITRMILSAFPMFAFILKLFG